MPSTTVADETQAPADVEPEAVASQATEPEAEVVEPTPGSITLVTGQTRPVKDLATVEAAFATTDAGWLVLEKPDGFQFKVRASAIVAYE